MGGHCTSSVIVCVCYAAKLCQLVVSDTILICLKIRLIDIHQKMSLKAAKQLLRREMKQKINMISKEEKQIQSANVSSKLFGGFQSFSVQNSV